MSISQYLLSREIDINCWAPILGWVTWWTSCFQVFFPFYLFVLLFFFVFFSFPLYFYPRTRNRGSNWRSFPSCKVDRVTRIELLTKLASLSGYELLSLVTHEWNLFVWIFSSCLPSFLPNLMKNLRNEFEPPSISTKRSKNCNIVRFYPTSKIIFNFA